MPAKQQLRDRAIENCDCYEFFLLFFFASLSTSCSLHVGLPTPAEVNSHSSSRFFSRLLCSCGVPWSTVRVFFLSFIPFVNKLILSFFTLFRLCRPALCPIPVSFPDTKELSERTSCKLFTFHCCSWVVAERLLQISLHCDDEKVPRLPHATKAITSCQLRARLVIVSAFVLICELESRRRWVSSTKTHPKCVEPQLSATRCISDAM